MKKIIILSLLYIGFLIPNINTSYAEEPAPIKVEVVEKIPWAKCVPKSCTEWEEWCTYECTVDKWFWTVVDMLWAIIKYFTFLAWLFWVLFLVINWIMYSMWWADQSLKDEAKKRVVWTILWLIVLFLSWVILNLIAPWIYK